MIEFFTICSISNKLEKNKNKENLKVKELFNNNENIINILKTSNINTNALNLVAGIIALIISIFTAKIAYNCNINTSPVSQIIAVLFGFFFSGCYLLYYFIWHILLKNKC
jgi:hypothetical protein